MIIKHPLHIAIDGPVAAGKSTVAYVLSQKLGISYVNTGRMYRLLAYEAYKNNLSYTDEQKLVALIAHKRPDLLRVAMSLPNDYRELYTPTIAHGASNISMHKSVRQAMVRLQRALLRNRSAVVEGRDIARRVLPNAALKIYLTAAFPIRLQRRVRQYQNRQQRIARDAVAKEVHQRDKQDSNRLIDPLELHADMKIVDTTNLTIDQVVDRIVTYIPKLWKQK